jgi:Mg2+-importing ATPase
MNKWTRPVREKEQYQSMTGMEDSHLLRNLSNLDLRTVYRVLMTSELGLTEQHVQRALQKHGKNVVAHEPPSPWYRMLLRYLKNPFVLVLLVIGVVSYLTGDLKATVVVSVMVGLSVLIQFVQEFRSSQATERLKAMVCNTATVTRQYDQLLSDGTVKRISEKREAPFEELVPGDIVHLSAGDMVPADLRLQSSKDLFISQAVLTGESMPVEKYESLGTRPDTSPPRVDEPTGNLLDRGNLCFMGTTVVSGTGTAVVATTGSRTYFGSMAKGIVGQRTLTSFDHGIARVTWVLLRFMLVMVPVIFVLNGLVKGAWYEALLFSLAVAVGLIPEMLPTVVTATLARGAVAMSRRKVIVKQLNALQNFGAMDVLCTDKTGTLTQDKVVLLEYLDLHGHKSLSVLERAYLNSYYQTGLKSLLDRAVLDHVELEPRLHVTERYAKVDEIPFDFLRRRMSVVVEQDHSQHLLICKGAVEEVLNICTHVEEGGTAVPLTEPLRQRVVRLMTDLNRDGLRVIAVASKTLPASDRPYAIADERDLALVGVLAFLDPPKETVPEALAALKDHGVQVKILTGDNDIVTRRVCHEVGLTIEQVALGSEIGALSDDDLAALAEHTTVFAKLNPLQKARIIRALQQKGHTVGFLGDGINDAAALRQADVGISVDTATDIAKESADIILLEKSLLVLEEGVLKGREVYGNIVKYIKMAASSNFGNMLSVLTASAFLPFLPMLPIQLLIQNLCYDLSQLSLPWDRMDDEFLKQPRPWNPEGIARFMVFIGPVSSLFDIITFVVMWVIFQANSPEHQALFQSGWFIEGLLSQTLIVHMIRTQKIPFLQSTAAVPVLWLTGIIAAIGLSLPFSSLGTFASMQPLPPSYFAWLGAILFTYALLTQLVKGWYLRRFHEWL